MGRPDVTKPPDAYRVRRRVVTGRLRVASDPRLPGEPRMVLDTNDGAVVLAADSDVRTLDGVRLWKGGKPAYAPARTVTLIDKDGAVPIVGVVQNYALHRSER